MYILGIDVSYAQGKNLPWKQIKANGIDFVICRAGHGIKIDDTFEDNIAGAKEAGLAVGSYWFFEPDKDPLEQALKMNTAQQKTEIVASIDVEVTHGVDREKVKRSLETFASYYTQASGSKGMLYTCFDFWSNTLGNPQDLMVCEWPLWVANYGVKTPLVPEPWSKNKGWCWWQYDGDGGQRLPDGRDSDFIYMKGEISDYLYRKGSDVAGEGTNEPGPNGSRLHCKSMIESWVTESLNRSAESIIDEMKADRNNRILSSDD